TVRTPGATERPTSLAVYRPSLPSREGRAPSDARSRQERGGTPPLSADGKADVVGGRGAAQDLPPVPGRGGASRGTRGDRPVYSSGSPNRLRPGTSPTYPNAGYNAPISSYSRSRQEREASGASGAATDPTRTAARPSVGRSPDEQARPNAVYQNGTTPTA